MTDDRAAGGAAPADDSVARAKTMAAYWRSMSPQRFIDGNVRFADLLHMQRMTAPVAADPAGEGLDWDAAAERLGDENLRKAEAYLAAGGTTSAINTLRAAVGDYIFAQMPLDDTDRKRELYAKLTETMRLLASIPEARTTRIEVPFGDGNLIGWLIVPEGEPRGGVVTFGGQSGWGPFYTKNALAMASRGIATFLVEGPGQGETRLEQGIYLDVDVAGAFSRFVDVLDELLPERSRRADGRKPIGIWGNSLGGLFAATAAARDDRIVACCVNSGIAEPRLLGMRTFDEQAEQMLGSRDPEAIDANLRRISFTPDMRMSADLFVIHGTRDPIVKLEDILPFLEGADPDRRRIKIWEGGDHTIYNHGDERNDLVSDWFLEVFEGDETRGARS